MELRFAVKLCGWFFDLDFCVYGFEVDPLRLLLYGCFLRSEFCGLFVSISFGDCDDAGGELHTAAFVFGRSGQVEYRLKYFSAV